MCTERSTLSLEGIRDNSLTQVIIDDDVKEIKSDLQDIKEKPTKRYEQVVGYILSALVGNNTLLCEDRS